MEIGEGERLEVARRRKFWRTIATLAAAGAAVGFMAGFVAGFEGIPIDQVWTSMSKPLVIALVAVALILFTICCWAFMRSIDEVELADNLWASTAAYYIYAVMFPAWWALGKADITGDPDHWLIFLAALGGGGAAYLYRKWRNR